MKKNDNLISFLEKCKLKENYNNFDYSEVDYISRTEKIKIFCKKHSISFLQRPYEHLKNVNVCNLCKFQATYTTDLFIERANLKHNNEYDYSESIYKDSWTKVKILCSKHGEFKQLPINHMKGQGCPKCGYIKSQSKNVSNLEIFINKANVIHNNKYDYSKSIYKNSITKLKIICPIHGETEQIPSQHLRTSGCYKCGYANMGKNRRGNLEDFINKSNIAHINKYDYSNSIYNTSNTKLKIICPIHGEFKQMPNDHIMGHGCSKCISTISLEETEINNFIVSLDIETITSNRSVIKPQQLDIYIPSKNIAIEYNGLYWHSELFKAKNYHLNKTKLCDNKKIQLIHIFSDEWINKKEIVKSRLKNILNVNVDKIYGRNCIIKEVNSKDSKIFLDNNHIQGFTPSKIKLGLYFKNELVSLMMFNKQRVGIGSFHDGYELTRFCSLLNTNVIGGASKLFNYFIKNYEFTKILSYSDNRWSVGKLYYLLGFKLTHINPPNYYYVIGKNRKHRFNFRKSELVKQGFDENKSEQQIMNEREIYRIYDCGTMCFEFKNPINN